jgi:hypothetical protein
MKTFTLTVGLALDVISAEMDSEHLGSRNTSEGWRELLMSSCHLVSILNSHPNTLAATFARKHIKANGPHHAKQASGDASP